MAGPDVGDAAPQFRLLAAGGGTIDLASYRGQTVVLYFYPQDDTKGCTTEALDFSAHAAAFAAGGAAIIGVSPDPVGSHDRFIAKHGLTGLQLASDPDHAVADAYGAWGEKTLYGRTYLGVIRSTFLIAPDGRIVQAWRNVRVKNHAANVLDAVRALTASGNN